MRFVVILISLLAAATAWWWVRRASQRGETAWWVPALMRGAAIGISVYVVLTLSALVYLAFFPAR